MVHWHTLTSNSETLSAADLGNHTPTVTITAVEGAAFESESGKTERKALISFAGKDKKLAAGTLNCICIEAMFGPEVEDWVGHSITLMADKVEVAGHLKGQPCIRIKGSPELRGNVTVDIKLPRRKPFQRVLVPTGSRVAQGTSGAADANVGPNPAMFGGGDEG